jgi:hypothetical protein
MGQTREISRPRCSIRPCRLAWQLRGSEATFPLWCAMLLMALLRRKRVVRFSAQEPTFIEPPECEILTQSSPSHAHSLENAHHSTC